MVRYRIGCERVPIARPKTDPDGPPLPYRHFVFEAEHPLCRAKAGKGEFTKGGEFVGAMLRELIGGENRSPQLTGQLFNARGKIDSRTNAGEIEPIAAADIAVKDIADVQRQAEAQPR